MCLSKKILYPYFFGFFPVWGSFSAILCIACFESMLVSLIPKNYKKCKVFRVFRGVDEQSDHN